MTALAVPLARRGRHHTPGPLRRLWRKVTEQNDRMLRDMAREMAERAELKENAGRIARSYALYIPAAVVIQCVAVSIPSLPVVAVAIGLTGLLFLIGVRL